MNEKLFLKLSIASFIVGMLGIILVQEFVEIKNQNTQIGDKIQLEGYLSKVSKFGGGFRLNLKNQDKTILVFTKDKSLGLNYGEKITIAGTLSKNNEIIADKVELYSL